MKTICLLMGALLLVQSCSGTVLFKNITIGFVVDNTGSMSGEIKYVRSALYNATFHLGSGHFRSVGIDHFILATFNDPSSLNRIYEFTDIRHLHTAANNIKATGGSDCPEYGFDGLLKAIKYSNRNSFLFYFSDASVKDAYREKEVINEANLKNIKIWIMSTGCCSGSDCSTYSAYKNVAERTKGVLYSIKEADLPVIMRFVNQNIRCKTFGWLHSPPEPFYKVKEWFNHHKSCPIPTDPPMPTIPPSGVSALSTNVFTVMMAVVAPLFFF